MARKTIGGLVASNPHNENYTELYNKVGELEYKTGELEDSAVSIYSVTFTAVSDNTSHIVHNLPYIPASDDLQVIYLTLMLEKSVNYTENVDNKSIDLLGWDIGTGEKIHFKLYKNVK